MLTLSHWWNQEDRQTVSVIFCVWTPDSRLWSNPDMILDGCAFVLSETEQKGDEEGNNTLNIARGTTEYFLMGYLISVSDERMI